MSFRGKLIGHYTQKYKEDTAIDSLRQQIRSALEKLYDQLYYVLDVTDEIHIDSNLYAVRCGQKTLSFDREYNSYIIRVKNEDGSEDRIVDRITDKGILSDMDGVTFDMFGDEQLDIYLEEAFEESLN